MVSRGLFPFHQVCFLRERKPKLSFCVLIIALVSPGPSRNCKKWVSITGKWGIHLIWTLYLMPLAFYLVFLGQNHQQGRIRVISGRLDFLYLLGCLSGFLILGGPRLLALIHFQLTVFSIVAGWEETWYLTREAWLGVFTLYGLFVVIGAAWVWKLRGNLTLVYCGSKVLVERAFENLSLDSHFKSSESSDAKAKSNCAYSTISEDPLMQTVEIRWPTQLLPFKGKYEHQLEIELSQIQTRPSWIWIILVTLGLMILCGLAAFNLAQAWNIIRMG